MAQALANNIANRSANKSPHLSVGMVGIDVLCFKATGHGDLALSALTAGDYPGCIHGTKW